MHIMSHRTVESSTKWLPGRKPGHSPISPLGFGAACGSTGSSLGWGKRMLGFAVLCQAENVESGSRDLLALAVATQNILLYPKSLHFLLLSHAGFTSSRGLTGSLRALCAPTPSRLEMGQLAFSFTHQVMFLPISHESFTHKLQRDGMCMLLKNFNLLVSYQKNEIKSIAMFHITAA